MFFAIHSCITAEKNRFTLQCHAECSALFKKTKQNLLSSQEALDKLIVHD